MSTPEARLVIKISLNSHLLQILFNFISLSAHHVIYKIYIKPVIVSQKKKKYTHIYIYILTLQFESFCKLLQKRFF